VETKAKIRRLHERERKPIREIARELRVSRNTVRKAVREKLFGAPRYLRQTQPCPKRGECVARLTGWLEQDSRLPKRQRRPAQGLSEDLCGEGYRGAYDSVQRYVKHWKARPSALAQVFIPLAFAPGEAYQFDFSEEEVEIAGAVLRGKVAQFKLCYSGMPLAGAYPWERLQRVLDAHHRGFAFFGGSPTRGIYDPLKTCVADVLTGKERRFNPRLLALRGHDLREPVACTPAAGWEKGQGEHRVGNLREGWFVPRPQFESWAALNSWLGARCLSIAPQRRHPKADGRTHGEVFEEERAVLTTVRVPFDGYVEHERRVSSTARGNFDRHPYRGDPAYPGRPVTLRA
jgi:transposase